MTLTRKLPNTYYKNLLYKHLFSDGPHPELREATAESSDLKTLNGGVTGTTGGGNPTNRGHIVILRQVPPGVGSIALRWL